MAEQRIADQRDQVKGAVDTVADKAKSATDWAAEKATKVKDRVSDWVSETTAPAQQMVGEAYDTSKDAVQRLGTNLTDAIREHPLTAIAIGFGIGLVLGRAANRV